MNDRIVPYSTAGGISSSNSAAVSSNVHSSGQPSTSLREFVLSAMFECGIRECEPAVVNQLCEFVQGRNIWIL